MFVILLIPVLPVSCIPDILYLMNTQAGTQHHNIARRTEEMILHQYLHYQAPPPDILWSSRDLHNPASLSSWTIFTLSKVYY